MNSTLYGDKDSDYNNAVKFTSEGNDTYTYIATPNSSGTKYLNIWDANTSSNYGGSYQNQPFSFTNGIATPSLSKEKYNLCATFDAYAHYKFTFVSSSSSPSLTISECFDYNLCSSGTDVLGAFTYDYETHLYTVTLNLTNGQKFHILRPKSGGNNWYGPSSNTDVSGSLTGGYPEGNGNYYTWTGESGEVTISFYGYGAEPQDVTISGQKSANKAYYIGTSPNSETIELTWGQDNDGTPCFTSTAISLVKEFSIKDRDGSYYGYSDTMTLGKHKLTKGVETNKEAFYVKEAYIYVYTDDNTEYGDLSEIAVYGEPSFPDIYLFGVDNNWTQNDNYKFEWDDASLNYSLTLSDGMSANIDFKVVVVDPYNSSKTYYTGDVNEAYGVETEHLFPLVTGGSNNNMYLKEDLSSVTFTLYTDGNTEYGNPTDLIVTGTPKPNEVTYISITPYEEIQLTWDSYGKCFTNEEPISSLKSFNIYDRKGSSYSCDGALLLDKQYSISTGSTLSAKYTVSNAYIKVYTDDGTEYGDLSAIEISGDMAKPTLYMKSSSSIQENFEWNGNSYYLSATEVPEDGLFGIHLENPDGGETIYSTGAEGIEYVDYGKTYDLVSTEASDRIGLNQELTSMQITITTDDGTEYGDPYQIRIDGEEKATTEVLVNNSEAEWNAEAGCFTISLGTLTEGFTISVDGEAYTLTDGGSISANTEYAISEGSGEIIPANPISDAVLYIYTDKGTKYSTPTKIIVKGTEKSASKIYMRGGDFGGWESNDYQFTWDSEKSCFTLSATSMSNEFKFYVSDGSWYRTSGDGTTSISIDTSYDVSKSGSMNNMKPNGTFTNVTIYLYTDTGDKYGVPASFLISSNSSIPTEGVSIYGDFSGEMNYEGEAMHNSAGSGSNQWEYNFTPTTSGTYHFYFYDATGRNGDAKEWAYSATANQAVSTSTSSSNFSSTTGYSFTLEATAGTSYVIKYWHDYGSNHKVEILGIQIPVKPIGIYNKLDLDDYNEPTYYLCSSVLNNDRVTPEYQFTKEGDDYVLYFTYRNTTSIKTASSGNWPEAERNFTVRKYATPYSSEETAYTGSSNNLDSKVNKEGRCYKATLVISDGKVTDVKLEDLGETLPFISFIGADWKQTEKVSTPNSHTTDSGWQEAWIQYDARGNVATDLEGNAMYNTMWPPRNPITFSTDTKIDGTTQNFQLNSDNLQFTSTGETKTGAEWKADARFADYDHADLDYTNLADVEDKEGYLCLDDDTSYTLYSVQNLWINGEVKLWTGWNGEAVGGTGASNWSNHSNWGHYGEGDKAVEVKINSTVPLSTSNGNIKFSEPTYFKNLYFFYDTANPEVKGHSVLLSERNYADAKISALSNADYSAGNFLPALGSTTGITDNISAVKIESFSTGGDQISTVLNLTGLDWDIDEFSDNLKSALTNQTASTGYFIDGYNYNNGSYKYRMSVTIGSRTVEAESNPFTIYNSDVQVALKAYQLVVNLDESRKQGDRVVDYYTYTDDSVGYWIITNDASHDDVIDSDNTDLGTQYTYGRIDNFDSNDSYFSDPTKCRWSNRLALVGTDVSNQVDKVTGYSIAGGNSFSSAFAQGTGARFMAVVKNNNHRYADNGEGNNTTSDDTSAEGTYNLTLQYEMVVSDANTGEESVVTYTTNTATTTYIPVIPEPVLEDAYLVGFYGDDTSADSDSDTKDFTYTINGKEITIEDAAYQNISYLAKVTWQNMSDDMMDKFVGNYEIHLGDTDITDSTIDQENGYGTTEYISGTVEPNALGTAKSITLATTGTMSNPVKKNWNDSTYGEVELSFENTPSLSADASQAYSYDSESGTYTEVFAVDLTLEDQTNTLSGVKAVGGESDFELHHGTENDYVLLTIYNKEGQVTEYRAVKATELIAGYSLTYEGDPVTWYADMTSTWTLAPKCANIKAQYIYPFCYQESAQSRMSRAAQAATGTFIALSEGSTTKINEVATGVESVSSENASIKAGIGYLEIEGAHVELYSIDGIHIASGAGHYDLNQGIYLVTLNGKTQKVIVR